VNMRRHRLSPICHPRVQKVARPAGLEPATPGLEGRCSIRTELRAHFRINSLQQSHEAGHGHLESFSMC
jgi:hypothetical protein